jgi:hypothetical protein
LSQRVANPLGAQAKGPCSCPAGAVLGMTGLIEHAIMQRD